ncbi:hypothetical protein COCNU_04G000660 [Cocos nucifera]|uniref:Uncharacterized protein n=1 Tax=Cocos nucifera TaxID=13894 RepID=A0A8K0MZ73_COCNU|nr:hypothetical protein COCNU_04G000660 [Cocos nucifera]
MENKGLLDMFAWSLALCLLRMMGKDRGYFSWTLLLLAMSIAWRLRNVGLDGSVNSLQLVDYGEETTLVDWSFEIDPIQGAQEETIVDYLAFPYKSCINRIEGSIDRAGKKEQEPRR